MDSAIIAVLKAAFWGAARLITSANRVPAATASVAPNPGSTNTSAQE